jgi:hypothetical protein
VSDQPLAAAPYRASDLVLWHKADVLTARANVCYGEYSGQLPMSFPLARHHGQMKEAANSGRVMSTGSSTTLADSGQG